MTGEVFGQVQSSYKGHRDSNSRLHTADYVCRLDGVGGGFFQL